MKLTLKQLQARLKDNHLSLDAETHTYWKNGTQYESVTSFLARFQVPFDTVALAAKVANEENRTPKNIISEWTGKAIAAKTLGRAVHKRAELIWATDAYTQPADEDLCPPGYVNSLAAFWQDFFRLRKALTEVQICSDLLRLAGTIDLLSPAPNSNLTLVDWKTGLTDPAVTGYTTMLPPIETLHQAPFNLYALQTHLYAHILRVAYDLNVSQLMIVWLDGRGRYEAHVLPSYAGHIDKLVSYRLGELHAS